MEGASKLMEITILDNLMQIKSHSVKIMPNIQNFSFDHLVHLCSCGWPSGSVLCMPIHEAGLMIPTKC